MPGIPGSFARCSGPFAMHTKRARIASSRFVWTIQRRAASSHRSSVTSVWKHAFRNALLPFVTLVALSLGYIVGGAITVEYVFSYPGIGLAIVEAIDQRDYTFLQGAFLVLTLSVIFFNFVADLLYFKLDPRVTT